ncbi:carbonic anhydrase/acetyltransferase-like protein (isoleucine patch superfamily) [Kribbella amoyensis]|uniref:Carbonic anhydrase/acetyltransferase-like protein (Isoleucine patch superfamily) n=1 Tax=Kribbella amoyensis TaxID=996641 RepID=A0A561BPJ7_9ACTN|nr:gamma carbonic anhydrase family protein [Kribbella amoyensis]TWD80800.1 carbonic anhydrase/acetyltransferase-like protein (isoleucine patch superfamily) [Kribbella amoyensis]
MLLEHRGRQPVVPESAYVAPSAVLCGAVVLSEGSRVLHGAVLTAENGEVHLGENSVVMENALVRGREDHPALIGDAVLVGPHAHVNGATVENEVFIATGASLFPGSVAGEGAELRINSVLHVNSHLPAGAVLPIGWIAAGNPATLYSPDQHEALWQTQEPLDFPGTVYGVPRGTPLREIMARQSAFYAHHQSDRRID